MSGEVSEDTVQGGRVIEMFILFKLVSDLNNSEILELAYPDSLDLPWKSECSIDPDFVWIPQ